MKMARHFLEWQRPEKWGKRRKRHVPHNTGVLVIGGDVTKKPEYDTTASVKARKWKSFSRKFREAKTSFLENFRTTLSGPQHLPIAKNEEAKRHDRGTLSQNEAFVACPALRANNAFTPLRSVRSAKNYNSPASSSAVRPSTKKRHNWNDLEIVANCKDTPIRRSGGNQRGNWRNERRPCVAMTGPTRAGDKSTRPRYGVNPTSMGNRIRWRA